MILLALVFSAVAFVLSASAGLGGSLVLVPGLMFLLGAKQGVLLAALLLGGNNIAKVIAYRATELRHQCKIHCCGALSTTPSRLSDPGRRHYSIGARKTPSTGAL